MIVFNSSLQSIAIAIFRQLDHFVNVYGTFSFLFEKFKIFQHSFEFVDHRLESLCTNLFV